VTGIAYDQLRSCARIGDKGQGPFRVTGYGKNEERLIAKEIDHRWIVF
jgi:hypothetical protein